MKVLLIALALSFGASLTASAQQPSPEDIVRRQRGQLPQVQAPSAQPPQVDCGAGAELRQENNRWRCVPTQMQGHRIWLATAINRRTYTEITFLNPGAAPNRVSCMVFSEGGVLVLDLGATQSVARGASGLCSLGYDATTPGERYSVLIVAQQPILPHGRTVSHVYHEANPHPVERTLDLYPIDCDHPAGFEFLCTMARGGR